MVSKRQKSATENHVNKTEIMKSIFPLIIFLMISFAMEAQDIPFNKSSFPGQRKELNQAKKQFRKGKMLAKQSEKNHQKAQYLLQSAHSFNPNNAELNFRLGELIFKSSNPHLALPYLEKAYALNPQISNKIQFLLGRAYHLNHNFEMALLFYNGYASTLKPKETKKLLPQLEKLKQQVAIGDSLVKNPLDAFIDNLGDRINSSWAEYAPVPTPDGKRLWFTSRRPGSIGGLLDKANQYFEDIYYLERTGSVWSEPINAGISLNTEKHESVVAVSPDGSAIYLRQGNPDGNLYVVRITDSRKKGKLQKLPKKINGKSDESSITFSPDSTRVWFVSDRGRGYGGKDIWMCEAGKRGGWKKPVNAGPVINTPFDEVSPFIDADGKTLYFSSRGHNTMGGYDVFMSTFSEASFSEPLNIGYPVNTSGNDIHFSIDHRGRSGWFASDRAGGFGNYDIYRVRFIDIEKPVIMVTDDFKLTFPLPGIESIKPLPEKPLPENIVLLKGFVINKENNKTLEAVIDFIDQNSGKKLVTKQTLSDNGMFLINMPVGNKCWLNSYATGFLPFSSSLDLAEVEPFSVYKLDVPMQKIIVGEGFELKRMTFRANLNEFHTGADIDIDLLVQFILMNPGVKILVQGYSLAGEDQLALPTSRAEIVRQFIVREGIAPGRVSVYEPGIPYEDLFPAITITPNNTGAIRIIVTGMD